MAKRVDLPKDIAREMNLWRKGLTWMPDSYIEFHQKLAMNRLDTLSKIGDFKVLRTELKPDGWMDGMKIIFAWVELHTKKDFVLKKLQWCDSNQDFMEVYQSGGAGIINLEAELGI